MDFNIRVSLLTSDGGLGKIEQKFSDCSTLTICERIQLARDSGLIILGVGCYFALVTSDSDLLVDGYGGLIFYVDKAGTIHQGWSQEESSNLRLTTWPPQTK